MAVLKLNEKFAAQFVNEAEINAVCRDVKKAYGVLASREGEGNDFLG